jgi:hypothetical protein
MHMRAAQVCELMQTRDAGRKMKSAPNADKEAAFREAHLDMPPVDALV